MKSIGMFCSCILALLSLGFGIAYCETVVYQYDDIVWDGGVDEGKVAILPFVLSEDVNSVSSFRLTLTGDQHMGDFECCGTGDCTTVSCGNKILAFVQNHSSTRTKTSLMWFDEPTWELPFKDYECEWVPGAPNCTSSPVSEDSWLFLGPGEYSLRVENLHYKCFYTDDNYCWATLDDTSMRLEIEYDPLVASSVNVWGTIKARYR